MKKTFCLYLHTVIGLFFFVISPHLSSAQHTRYFQHLSVGDGLSHNNVVSIVEDKEGYMWFATRNGLNRYDGASIKIFEGKGNKEGELSYDGVSCVTQDYKDRIWVGTDEEGINWYDKKKERFYKASTKDGCANFKGKSVRRLKTSNGGKVIWVLTEAGLNKIDAEKLTSEHFLTTKISVGSQIKEISPSSFFIDRRNRILLGTYGGGIFIIKNKKEIIHINHQLLVTTNIEDIEQDDEGNIWVATSYNGVLMMDDRGQNIKQIMPSGKRILSLMKDSQGNIWIGTENNGIYIYYQDTKTFENYINDPEDTYSIGHNSVYTTYQDRSGRIWAGTFNQGVSYWDKYAIKFEVHRHKNKPNSLSNNIVSCFAEGETPNQIWIGTDGGGLNLWNRTENTYKVFNQQNTKAIHSDAVLTLYKDKQDGLWIGGWNFGLVYKDKEGSFKDYEALKTKGVLPQKIFKICPDKKGNLWLATFNNGLCYYNLKENIITSYDDIHHTQLISLTVDEENTLWAGSIKGLYKLTPSQKNQNGFNIAQYTFDKTKSNALPHNAISFIYIDSKKRTWIGTSGGGLCLYQPESNSFEVFDKTKGFPSNNISSMQEDENGMLWISSSKGLFSFVPEQNEINTFTTKDGLQNLVFFNQSSYLLSSGEMLFGGIKGFNLFNPQHIQNNPLPPNIYLTGLKLFNKPVGFNKEGNVLQKPLKYTEQLTFNHKQSVFTVDYIGINLTHPDRNKYAYIMKGFENEWNYVGNQSSATYTNLDAGEYTFMVKSANSDGVWTEQPQAISIMILPPWWETIWFKVLVTLTFILSGITFYKVRVRNLKVQKEKLEQKVKERTSELVQKQKEIEGKNTALQQQSEEIELQNQELQVQSEELIQQAEEITSQRDAIEHQHKALEDVYHNMKESIRYAKSIQQSILPTDNYLKETIGEYFIIYKPKDIVSGDFYWSTEVDGKIFLVCADCTGHGVPGAFMSMIGNVLLNKSIKELKVQSPAEILSRLHKGVQQALHQKVSDNEDGMDISICVLDKKEDHTEIVFSGAKTKIYYYQQGQETLQILNGDRSMIGGFEKKGKDNSFTDQKFILNQGDMLYMSTDGFIDQNNPERRRFGTKQFTETLSEICILPVEQQYQKLNEILDEHQQKASQRDDITVIGVKI